MGSHPVRVVRLGAGLILLAYLTTHFLNHALGIVSLDAMEAGRVWFLLLWRNPVATTSLYAALITHALLGSGPSTGGARSGCRRGKPCSSCSA